MTTRENVSPICTCKWCPLEDGQTTGYPIVQRLVAENDVKWTHNNSWQFYTGWVYLFDVIQVHGGQITQLAINNRCAIKSREEDLRENPSIQITAFFTSFANPFYMFLSYHTRSYRTFWISLDFAVAIIMWIFCMFVPLFQHLQTLQAKLARSFQPPNDTPQLSPMGTDAVGAIECDPHGVRTGACLPPMIPPCDTCSLEL